MSTSSPLPEGNVDEMLKGFAQQRRAQPFGLAHNILSTLLDKGTCPILRTMFLGKDRPEETLSVPPGTYEHAGKIIGAIMRATGYDELFSYDSTAHAFRLELPADDAAHAAMHKNIFEHYALLKSWVQKPPIMIYATTGDEPDSRGITGMSKQDIREELRELIAHTVRLYDNADEISPRFLDSMLDRLYKGEEIDVQAELVGRVSFDPGPQPVKLSFECMLNQPVADDPFMSTEDKNERSMSQFQLIDHLCHQSGCPLPSIAPNDDGLYIVTVPYAAIVKLKDMYLPQQSQSPGQAQ